jgi:poly-beta-1,6-N-acetyl-D-glucosamine synthase
VVASGCTDDTERIVEVWQRRDSRILLIRQSQRLGKASGLNEILNRARGELIIMLNADASLQDGALAALMRPFASDPNVLVACGAPKTDSSGEGMARIVAHFYWELHNRTLDALSQRRLANHCCDELMAMRHGFVRRLPPGLVNDGAYIGVLASLQGVSVRFCQEAVVSVEIPSSLRGFIAQRRRILHGHDQIEDLLHRSSNTLEHLFGSDPLLALAIAGRQVFSRPASLFSFLLVILPVEVLANLLVFKDRMTGLRYDPVWPPVE